MDYLAIKRGYEGFKSDSMSKYEIRSAIIVLTWTPQGIPRKLLEMTEVGVYDVLCIPATHESIRELAKKHLFQFFSADMA
jgi:hypothetical protein